ncbi:MULTISPECIES: dihydrolipoamide acetyltransferase family protein [unclassified Oceanispirochaeta]|uniref:dihydrolipoamide acetyltransferase family protein n=1 Tax=unclassified Oceanispirochaeta TaxID=2635722 RepID=UPI000E0984BE|nr:MULTISPECIES: dihydrolipoamide acetyltransferase family protein [unclassified Oceanispirochaeta]MBF9014567.1 2-oxo acid dehydrogenase subunit E2 [Oceanispirochaeta sp. M2]NPD70823.1 2-oxo acid dehydrogenase subunit E2 [Oceanispirochaeta sp. M1]RDG34105.1 2-oxo acid dehydrogenase subunit E2 [Oceanispirochaeta sp. M1]
MAEIVVMPKAGNSVESCIILEWTKSEGDTVSVGDVLCEAETDKATVTVESTASGVLLKQLFQVDDDVPVMQPMAVIGEAGEDITALLAELGSGSADSSQASDAAVESPAAAEASPAEQSAVQASQEVAAGTSGFASPRARNLAAAKAVALDKISGTGPEGRIVERDVLAALEGQAPLTPAAMEELIRSGKTAPARGTGLGGRVLKSDLLDVPAASAVLSSAAVSMDFPGEASDIKVKGVRKITASRMLESLTQTAQLTMNTSADATRILALRKRLKNSPEEMGLQKVTINDLVMLVTARTLKDFPEMNAHFLGDSIKQFKSVHLGCAVDTPRGLMVPVVRFADTLSLKELGTETKRVFGKCLEGQVDPEELTGGTFTITNLGAMGIESFTPVLNKPEVGILGVCTIQPKPVMKGEDVAFIPHMGLSLTFDHQATDGAPAGRFLKALVANLENIDLVLAL